MVIAVVRPTPPGHCGRFRGIAANRLSCFVAGRQVTMVLPRPWRVVAVVEVVDQHVAGLDLAGGDGRDDDRIRVLIAVRRHRGGGQAVAANVVEEALRLRRLRGHREGQADHRQKQRVLHRSGT
jgi:hypothetical protein